MQCFKTTRDHQGMTYNNGFPLSLAHSSPLLCCIRMKYARAQLNALSSTSPQAIVAVKEKPKTPQLISFEIKMI